MQVHFQVHLQPLRATHVNDMAPALQPTTVVLLQAVVAHQ
jgi:hypothetical protein